jgi:transcriptional regulator of nitric oxide reductase
MPIAKFYERALMRATSADTVPHIAPWHVLMLSLAQDCDKSDETVSCALSKCSPQSTMNIELPRLHSWRTMCKRPAL